MNADIQNFAILNQVNLFQMKVAKADSGVEKLRSKLYILGDNDSWIEQGVGFPIVEGVPFLL